MKVKQSVFFSINKSFLALDSPCLSSWLLEFLFAGNPTRRRSSHPVCCCSFEVCVCVCVCVCGNNGSFLPFSWKTRGEETLRASGWVDVRHLWNMTHSLPQQCDNYEFSEPPSGVLCWQRLRMCVFGGDRLRPVDAFTSLISAIKTAMKSHCDSHHSGQRSSQVNTYVSCASTHHLPL